MMTSMRTNRRRTTSSRRHRVAMVLFGALALATGGLVLLALSSATPTPNSAAVAPPSYNVPNGISTNTAAVP